MSWAFHWKRQIAHAFADGATVSLCGLMRRERCLTNLPIIAQPCTHCHARARAVRRAVMLRVAERRAA